MKTDKPDTKLEAGSGKIPSVAPCYGSFDSVKKDILKNLDHSLFVSGLYETSCKLKFGDFVISGMNTLGEQVIGYVVQVRKQWGAFGSDMFFLREHDGTLRTHENQSFWKLSDEQVEAVLPFFKDSSSDELEGNKNLEYSILSEQKASGFIVTDENAPDRVDSCSFAITVTGGVREEAQRP